MYSSWRTIRIPCGQEMFTIYLKYKLILLFRLEQRLWIAKSMPGVTRSFVHHSVKRIIPSLN